MGNLPVHWKKMHIGKLIKEQLQLQGKTIVWFAGQLSCHRTNVYKILSKRSIDTHELERISKILNYDFFSVYSQQLRNSSDM